MGTLGKKETDQTRLALVPVTLIGRFISLMWHHHNKPNVKAADIKK